MKSLLPVLVLAMAAVAAPVVAQPIDITVPYYGPGDSYDGPRPFYNDDYVYGSRTWDDPGRFDPAAAAINALNISHFNVPRGRSNLNYNRAITLNATGDSILEHQLKCQAAYASYDLATDTYLSDHGIPRPCRL
jgi:hypothetical protein